MNIFNTNHELFLNSNNPHQIIKEENTYYLLKKYLTVHANDRDVKYYPNSNEFSIKCPQAYTNVQSITLTEISFPNPINNFSENLKNNRFFIKKNHNTTPITITINPGFYTQDDVSNTGLGPILQEQLNSPDASFNVTYNKRSSTFTIKNTTQFSLINNPDTSSIYCNSNYQYNYQHSLGFLHTIGIDITNDISSSDISDTSLHNSSISQKSCKFLNRQPIYLEIDKVNVIDELNPYPKGSNNLYNNFSNTSINSAFMKIPAPPLDSVKQDYSRSFGNTNNVTVFFDTPLQRLQNLRFKFRYHDGRLVDLQDQDVNFTLEINELRNEIPKSLNVRS